MAYSEAEMQASIHPCYSPNSQHTHARMHLPVAPACNIQCNYCNRLYDCASESRPGVTSSILTPGQAMGKIDEVKGKIANLAVIGIAGPGDALANWPATRATLAAVRKKWPELLLCLSTNGLLLPAYADELAQIGVRHVTVTVNAVDSAIGEKIYRHVDWKGERLQGKVAASLLLEQQLTGIHLLAKAGVMVKVNIVMVPGINDGHIPAVVRTVKSVGASLTNIMPLIPASGSAFAAFPQTNHREVCRMRDLCQPILPQMRHCQQCRADAVGLLAQDRSAEFHTPVANDAAQCKTAAKCEPVMVRPYRIAVSSRSETLIDQHFGHAARFLIFELQDTSVRLAERRNVEKYCSGNEYCGEESAENSKQLALQNLADCDAVLTLRIGSQARARLQALNISVIESCLSISEGLQAAREYLMIQKAG